VHYLLDIDIFDCELELVLSNHSIKTHNICIESDQKGVNVKEELGKAGFEKDSLGLWMVEVE
jgi:hypothetical protein